METKERGDVNLPDVSYTIMAIDLGETTGVAWYGLNTQCLRCDSIEHPEDVVPVIFLIGPDVIILESFPVTRTLSYEIERAYADLKERSFLVSPGNWKPFMKGRKRYFSQAHNQHERDAINILRYYLLITFKKDVK